MMKILLCCVLASAVFAEEENMEKLLHSAGKQTLEKIEESIDFSTEELKVENEVAEYAKEDLADLVEEQRVEIQHTQSLKGVIEKETASYLPKEENEATPKEKKPQLEDLAHLAEQSAAQIPENEKTAYDTLSITTEEKQKIATILITMAENNVFQLLFEKKHLERLGHEINHVHPVRFLGTVFSDPRLIYCMKCINRSGFKWDGFIDGFSQRFKQEIKANNIYSYIPGLAKNLNVQEGNVRIYVDNKDFEGLVLYLMENASPTR